MKKVLFIISALAVSFAVTIGLNKVLLNLFGSQKIVYNSETGDGDVGFGYPGDDLIPFVIFFGCLVLISLIADKIKK